MNLEEIFAKLRATLNDTGHGYEILIALQAAFQTGKVEGMRYDNSGRRQYQTGRAEALSEAIELVKKHDPSHGVANPHYWGKTLLKDLEALQNVDTQERTQ